MKSDQDNPAHQLGMAFEAAAVAFRAEPNPGRAVRRERLQRLEAALLDHADRLVAAMKADFGHRSDSDASIFDITIPLGDIRRNRRHLAQWMKPRNKGMPLHLLPARGRVIPQPKGVVGVIAPWNFPVYLSLAPAAAALAAGNRVLLKPSELTPRTSEALQRMVAESFNPAEFSVHTGGVDTARAFADLPFAHLLFTGSTRVGRDIALAAARHLTPVTLELGGKSPAIVGEHADVVLAAHRIAFGKTANAGQICVAPDYALVPRQHMNTFVREVQAAILRYYPQGPASDDFSGIISEGHRQRLKALLADAAERGARLLPVIPEGTSPDARKQTPTLVIDPPVDSRVMLEEIFGPILPIVPYDSLEHALAFVRDRPAPLALYVFTHHRAEREAWIGGTLSGGACVNETAFHVLADTMPFGGVGESGMGAYHGEAGFQTFSHLKSVLYQPKWNAAFLFNPPMGGLQHLVGKVLRKII